MLAAASIYHLPIPFSTEFQAMGARPALDCGNLLPLSPQASLLAAATHRSILRGRASKLALEKAAASRRNPKPPSGAVNSPPRHQTATRPAERGTAKLHDDFMVECTINADGGSTMNFAGRYQILEMLSDGETRTFKAVQISSGRNVLLHQLWVERTPPNQPDLASLVFGFLRGATADEMKILVDMGEEASRVFVVTEDLPVCQNLRQWLQSPAGRPGTAPTATMPKSAQSADSGAPEKLRGSTFDARQKNLVSPDTAEPSKSPKVMADQTPSSSTEIRSSTPAAPPREAPSGTTTLASPDQITGHPGGSPAAEALKISEPPVVPATFSKAADEPGEFTRIFLGKDLMRAEATEVITSPPEKSGAPPASKSEKPAQTQVPSGSGFDVASATRIRQPRSATQPPVEKTSPPQTPGLKEEAAGDFTRIFYGRNESKAMPPSTIAAHEGTPLTPTAPEQPSNPEGPGEFTRLFQAPQVKEQPSAAPSVQAEPSGPFAPPVQPPVPQGPGEFTQLFRPGAPATRPAGPPISRSSPQPAVPFFSSLPQRAPGELTQLLQAYQPGKSAGAPSLLEQPAPAVPPPPPKVDKAGPGEFTLIFQQPPGSAAPPPPAASSTSVGQTPPAAPQSSEPGEYTRMFELPRGGAGASPQAASQMPPPAAPQPAGVRAAPVIPVTPVSLPMAPSMPYVQPPVVPQPQPYVIPGAQFQQPAAPSAFAMPPQPVPQVQPMAIPVPPAPQATPPKTGKSKLLVPLIILGVLFIVALVVVLFFAVKH